MLSKIGVTVQGLTNLHTIVLIVILALALGLRLWGISFGLPYEYHVDEVQYVRQAASMGERGLEPTWWNNPPFYKYVLFAEYAALFVIGRALGAYASVAEFGRLNSLDPTLLYLLGRITSAFFGTATVLTTYWLGKTAYNRRTGLIAAFFLAVCFVHVRDSHYAVNDAALVFFVTVGLLACAKIVQRASLRWYVVAGIATGVGFATKYTAAFVLVPLLTAHTVSRMNEATTGVMPKRRLALGLAVAGIAAAVASPYFVIAPSKVVSDVYRALFLAGHYGFDGWEIDPSGGYAFYLKSLAWGLGWPLLALSLAGLVIAVVRHCRQDVVFMSLPVVMYLVLGRQQMFFARFILPAVPALVVLGSCLLEKIVSSLVRSRSIMMATASIAAVLVGGQPLAAVLRHDALLTSTDTRTQAKTWIEANIAENSKIAVDWPVHGPPLATQEKGVPNSTRLYDVTIVGGSGLSEHSAEYYRENGYDYLIASSFIYNIPLVDKEQDAARRAFYASLDKEFKLVKVFKPYSGENEPPFIFDQIYGPATSLFEFERPGPTLKIYQVVPK